MLLVTLLYSSISLHCMTWCKQQRLLLTILYTKPSIRHALSFHFPTETHFRLPDTVRPAIEQRNLCKPWRQHIIYHYRNRAFTTFFSIYRYARTKKIALYEPTLAQIEKSYVYFTYLFIFATDLTTYNMFTINMHFVLAVWFISFVCPLKTVVLQLKKSKSP